MLLLIWKYFHKALEKYARRVEREGLEWTEVTKEQQEQFASESVDESIVDYSNTVIYSSARNAYIVPRMKRMMNRTVWAMTKQLRKGSFKPEGYEVSFGSGKIDRIDTCETEDQVYVKILDYKTGAKSFDMAAFIMVCRCSWWCIWKKQSGWRKENIRVKRLCRQAFSTIG